MIGRIRYIIAGVVAFIIITGVTYYLLGKTNHNPPEPIFHSPQVEQRLKDWRDRHGRDPNSIEEWRKACSGVNEKAAFGTVCQEVQMHGKPGPRELDDSE